MIAALLSVFDQEMTRTAAVLDAVPSGELSWAPHPRSFTLGRLAMHVAALPGWMAAFTSRDGYDMGAGGPGPPSPSSIDDIREAFEEAAARGRAALCACDADALDAPWALRRDGAVVVHLTRATAIQTFAFQHLAHHRGQLTVYLRLLGRAVPPLYGDSADARLSAETTGSA